MKSKATILSIALVILLGVGMLVPSRHEKGDSRTSAGGGNTSIAAIANPTKQPSRPLISSTTKATPSVKALPTWNSAFADPKLATFSAWYQQYAAGSPAEKQALEAEGIALAQERRAVMIALIQSDPQAALKAAVPVDVSKSLPPSIAELLEKHVSGRGNLDVLAALAEPGKESEVVPIFRTATFGEREYKAFVYGRRLGEPTRRSIPMNGIALDDLMAVNENPVRVLETEEAAVVQPAAQEAICSVSGEAATVIEEPTPVDVGGEIIFLCRRAHADVLNDQLIKAEAEGVASSGNGPEASAYTEGQKKLLVIRVDFDDLAGVPFTDLTGTNLVTGLNGFYTEMSYGRTSFALLGAGSELTPTFRMPKRADYYGTNDFYNQLRTDARAAAAAAGYVLTNYNLDLICMKNVPGWGWSGLGYVGAPGAWIRNSFGTGVSAHELGHNYGLNHANFWDTSAQSIIGAGTSVEYGDSFDTMGAANAGANHFNARYKSYLNWLTSSETLTVTTNGTYRIYSHDNPNSTGLRGLKIVKNSNTNYWIEFRQKFTSNKYLMSGVGLRWAQNGNQKSQLLDTTVGSVDGKNDACIVMGRTFSDKTDNIHITCLGKGGTSPESVDVRINRGPFPTNVPPTALINANITNTSAGVTLNFSVTASDANGDALAYYWDFGDGNFGTNSPSASKSWTATGEYNVRCIVSDMKGGIASDSVVIRVGAPTTYRINGQVTSNGQPVEGVRVYASSTKVAYTDSDGTYNLVGLPAGSYTVAASLEGHVFQALYSNPVTVGPNAKNVDFRESSIPDIILDNNNAAYTGTWTVGNSAVGRYGTDYHYISSVIGNATHTATYRPTIVTAGHYDIWIWYPAASNRATDAPWLTTDNLGTFTALVDQTTNGGFWLPIARGKYFAAGTSGYVRLSNNGIDTTRAVIADAVRFTYASNQQVPAGINNQPLSRSVTVGSSVNFTVIPTGTPPFGYQWRRNGTNLPSAQSSSYTIPSAQVANAGDYSVMVTNAYGSKLSVNAALTVNVPPSISTQPQNQTVKVGANAAFTVAAAGTAPLGYQWRFNGANILGATTTSLTLNNTRTNAAGNYSVIVSNVAGSVTSSNAFLTVVVPKPLQLGKVNLLSGQKVQFVLTGEPGTACVIECSTNLVSWTELSNLSVNASGWVEFVDDSATNTIQRFYRVRLLP